MKIKIYEKKGAFCYDKIGKKYRITDRTDTSIEVEIPPSSSKGILSKNWFSMDEFNKRFLFKNS